MSLVQKIGNPRVQYFGVAVIAAALIGFAIYLQEVDHLEPCPLCILQRYAYVTVAAAALLAALLPRFLGRILAWLGILLALAGAGVGAWHVWLQLHPPKVSACGPSLEYLVGNLPLGRALPRIFQGYGDCTEIQWTFLGITIPGWSLMGLVLLAVILVVAQRRRG
jgi:disulfide bond formation protein DsbB